MSGEIPVIRSIVAIGAGFFAATVMSLGGDIAFNRLSPGAYDAAGRALSDDTLLIKLLYETVFAIAAGYITARIAIRRPYWHALLMGTVVVLSRGFVVAVTWPLFPAWFQIGALAVIIPAALLGAKLSELRSRALQ